MSKKDDLIKQILAATTFMPTAPVCGDDQLPEELSLPAEFFDGAPDLNAFRDREPDSFDEPGEHNLGSLALLGSYHHMHSPGVITLYRGNIESYWRSLLSHAYKQFPFIHQKDAKRVLQLLVHSVHEHERFHYICDFSRRLFHSSFDRWHEEALAVAREWHVIKANGGENTTFGRLNPTLSRIVVHEMFRHTSRGYRDWRQFSNEAIFLEAVRDYLHPGAAQIFTDATFNFGRWVVDHVGSDANVAYREEIA